MKNYKKILSFILALLCISSFTGCLKYTDNILEVTTAPLTSSAPVTEPTTRIIIPTTTQQNANEPTSIMPESTTANNVPTTNANVPTTVPYATEPSVPTTQTPVTQAPTEPSTAAAKDPSQWSKAETLKFLTDAMNKSRAVTTPVNVHHSENFSFTVSDMAKTVADIVNKIIASVAKPSEEDMSFNGGKATNSEGETVPLLLPKNGNFFLDEAGCKAISASKSGSDTIIKVTLVQEVVDMTTPPKYNSSACGYLDTSTLDIPSIIKISNFNIDYQGTDITFTVNSDGYVSKAAYHVPLNLDIAGSAIGISASIKINGYEDEVWDVKW